MVYFLSVTRPLFVAFLTEKKSLCEEMVQKCYRIQYDHGGPCQKLRKISLYYNVDVKHITKTSFVICCMKE